MIRSLLNELQSLVEKLEGVDCAWIFGSTARQEAGPLSDLDVALLFEEGMDPAGRAQAAVTLMGKLQRIGGPRVDVVVLNDAPPAFQHRVLRDGRLIFCRDPARRVRFEVRAIREYLDFQPVLERYDRLLLQRAREGRLGSR
jgi:predicted nucleotidyltransferase